jgi:hypothetical protein
LLNRGAFEDVDLTRPNEGGILLVVDVNSKSAFIAHGYLLDFYLTEKDTFRILSKAHPHLLKGEHCRALKIVISQLSSVLKKRARQAKRNPAKYQKRAGCFPLEDHQLLQPLRHDPERSSEGGGESVADETRQGEEVFR